MRTRTHRFLYRLAYLTETVITPATYPGNPAGITGKA
jgi:hypothetical protein